MSENIRFRSQLAYLLAAEIHSRNLTQKEFARLVDVDPATISRILTGQRQTVQDITLEKLAAITDLTLEDLRCALNQPANRTSRKKPVASIPDSSIIYSTRSIERCVDELAKAISAHYEDRPFIVICILNGAWIFVADLVRKIRNTEMEIEFIRTSKYQVGNEDSGEVNLVWDILIDVGDKELLVVDDIADTGETLDFVVEHLWKKNPQPKDIRTCALLNKTEKEPRKDILIDFFGLKAPNRYLVGYGMDSNLGNQQSLRNTPDILALGPAPSTKSSEDEASPPLSYPPDDLSLPEVSVDLPEL